MARRFRRWPGVLTTLFAVLLTGAGLRVWLQAGSTRSGGDVISSMSGGQIMLQSGPCRILAAEDGNTLLVEQGQRRFRVRLIGVRLPPEADEQHARGELSRLAPAGPATIELDKRRAAADGSWLAYVTVGHNLVNAEVLASGQAIYDVYPGDSFTVGRRLKEAQDDARRSRRGVWQAAE